MRPARARRRIDGTRLHERFRALKIALRLIERKLVADDGGLVLRELRLQGPIVERDKTVAPANDRRPARRVRRPFP